METGYLSPSCDVRTTSFPLRRGGRGGARGARDQEREAIHYEGTGGQRARDEGQEKRVNLERERTTCQLELEGRCSGHEDNP